MIIYLCYSTKCAGYIFQERMLTPLKKMYDMRKKIWYEKKNGQQRLISQKERKEGLSIKKQTDENK